ncbi:hypothetical protein SCG7086_BD_00100 [Chlamydiales bacterium SCGC AG-110-P3]|nr:hypothetical protein SCG7086_BD_00100 [Chlamydiales bacterium SCGC AG-110-P3]
MSIGSDFSSIIGVVHFRVTLLETEIIENGIALRGTQNRAARLKEIPTRMLGPSYLLGLLPKRTAF